MRSSIPPEWNEANRAMRDERVPLHPRRSLLRPRRFEPFEERDGYLRFPTGRPRVPLMYSLRARKDRPARPQD
ncbi:hypothetical protein AB0C70_18485 [Streptomyces sp. NPDC048564]|uniref:hypothetical protein n=1 Tax=unclassified Streptomyces TaxID=2593676 RepID=UPI0034199CEF